MYMVCQLYPIGKSPGFKCISLRRRQTHRPSFLFSSASIFFLNSSIDLFAGVFKGLARESFKADIQRELPPLAALRAIAYMTKFAPTTSRIMINKPMAGLSISSSCLISQKDGQMSPVCKDAARIFGGLVTT